MSHQSQPVLKIGQYVLGETLGKGTFGKVKIGTHVLTKEKVAVKILNRQKIKKMNLIGKLRSETLKLFKHPHVIQMYQVIFTPTDIFMIMEYASGGELFQYIVKHGKLKENEARRFFQQIISGVDFCHQQKIVHRDLKPENLLLDHNLNVKIADFGLSNIMVDGEFLKTSCGSPNYAAPEVISGKLYAGPEIDIWSCGVILYVLMCGVLPFEDEHIPTLYNKIISGKFVVPNYLNESVVSLICHMLQVNPIKRATIADIRNHEWFKTDLPDYLFSTQAVIDASEIDPDAVREVSEKFGVQDSEVYNALLSGDTSNHLAISYQIITDNKGIDIDAKAHETCQSHEQKNSSRPPHSVVHSDNISVRLKNLALKHDHWNLKHEQWHLGIRSQSRPADIMRKVFLAMKQLDFEWKVINPFHTLVRYKESKGGSTYSKLSLQLYQLDRRIYLLDFKMLPPDDHQDKDKGPSPISPAPQIMEFFEMCAALIKTLVR